MDMSPRRVLIICLIVNSNLYTDYVEADNKFSKKAVVLSSTTPGPISATNKAIASVKNSGLNGAVEETVTTKTGIATAAGWKFWKKNKKHKTKTTSTTEAPAAVIPSLNPFDEVSDELQSEPPPTMFAVTSKSGKPGSLAIKAEKVPAAGEKFWKKNKKDKSKTTSESIISASNAALKIIAPVTDVESNAETPSLNQYDEVIEEFQSRLSPVMPVVSSKSVKLGSSATKDEKVPAAGGKFWNKNKKDKTKMTSTTEVPAGVTLRSAEAKSDFNVAEAIGTDVESSARPQLRNPLNGVTKELSYGATNEHEASDKNHMNRAVDLTGAGESSQQRSAIPVVISTSMRLASSTTKAKPVAAAGWKFWKRSKKDKTKTTSITSSTEASTSKAIASSTDWEVDDAVEATETDVQRNKNDQKNEAADLTHAGEPSQLTVQKPSSADNSQKGLSPAIAAAASTSTSPTSVPSPSNFAGRKTSSINAGTQTLPELNPLNSAAKKPTTVDAGTQTLPITAPSKPPRIIISITRSPRKSPQKIQTKATSKSESVRFSDVISTNQKPTTEKSSLDAAVIGSRPASIILDSKPSRSIMRGSDEIPSGAAIAGIVVRSMVKKGNTNNPTYDIDKDLENLFEVLYKQEIENCRKAQKQTTSNSQSQTTSSSPARRLPTIEKLLKLYDKYKWDISTADSITPAQRNEERQLADTMLSTNVMSTAMRFLADKNIIAKNYYTYKDTLRRIWFTAFSRHQGPAGPTSFERVFLNELKFGTEVRGHHKWVYCNTEELKKRADYLGYMKKLNVGDNAMILKLNEKLNDSDNPVRTIIIGMSPELEMAIYTVCFFVRPNQACLVSLDGIKFNVITRKSKYDRKEFIELAYPEI